MMLWGRTSPTGSGTSCSFVSSMEARTGSCTFWCVLYGVALGIGLLLLPTVLRRVGSFQHDSLCIFIVLGPIQELEIFKMTRQGLCPRGAHCPGGKAGNDLMGIRQRTEHVVGTSGAQGSWGDCWKGSWESFGNSPCPRNCWMTNGSSLNSP